MNGILTDLSLTALATAIEANRIAFSLNFGCLPRSQLYEDAEISWFITGAPFMMANAVARTQLSNGNVDARIDETLNHFQARGLPMSWWVGPMMQPANLGSLLEKRGLSGAQDTPGMAVDLHSLNDAPVLRGLTIERVTAAKSLNEWIAIAKAMFNFPECMRDLHREAYTRLRLGVHAPWCHYLGWLDGKPVAISSLLLAAGVAGIWAVATLPEARGQGIGAAITLAPLRDARAMGYRVGILNSSPMGMNVYRRLGFQEYCKVGFYVWAGDNKADTR